MEDVLEFRVVLFFGNASDHKAVNTLSEEIAVRDVVKVVDVSFK